MKHWVGQAFRQYGIFLGFLCVIIVLSLLEPSFRTSPQSDEYHASDIRYWHHGRGHDVCHSDGRN